MPQTMKPRSPVHAGSGSPSSLRRRAMMGLWVKQRRALPWGSLACSAWAPGEEGAAWAAFSGPKRRWGRPGSSAHLAAGAAARGPGAPRVAAAAAAAAVVDLRSDTVSRPSQRMRRAMAAAEVGDDDYGEDPTVNELQRVVAELLGMEEALFVPTATMANLIAVMCHCHRRGAQVLLGKKSHIHVFEHGGVAQVAGVHSELLQDLPNGLFCLDELECKIQQAHKSQYHPRPELICLENTHCSAGGRVLPLMYLREVHQLAQQYGLRIHMDGARVLNAAVALGVPATRISQHCDSISLCLSKGVGAPAGALLAGSKELLSEAWRVRKLLGGGMRQAGVLAAAGLVGLSQMEETLEKDHSNARCFAQGASAFSSSLCFINPATVETNIVMVTVLTPGLTPVRLCELMEAVSEEEIAVTGQAISVRLFPWGEHCLRAVWHCDVSPHDTQLAVNKLRFVLDRYEQ
ncbi:probable low-specificity L-threonine aldolase 2 [Sceloporus undulatus]|uniref:probable low-specificity L-threonine aldolase 2 n=1 Tax=Sceloporus undulatus TaxID=8520 RepID=UPI001C4CE57D|nr:probable low-specificity L-threonine aldolase 2 [Sceloporus undulatus]